LIEQRTALVNQLQAALREYYPAALAAFDDWTAPHAWTLILQFPTPGQLQAAGQRKWEKFLHTQGLWRPQTTPRRLAVFAAANALPASPAITAAKSLLAFSLAKILSTLQTQLEEYRRRITTVFQQHPDHDVFGSLPGAKAILGPRLLAELGHRREEYPDPDALLCQAGVSPVSYQSGQVNKCRLRRACNKVLRTTVHLWVNASRMTCAWAQTYYQQKRTEGHSHASALRCLGKRWLKILWRLWQRHEIYNEQKHLAQLKRRGSPTWVNLHAATGE